MDSAAKRILCALAHPATSRYLSAWLGAEGYTVTAASTAAESLRLAAAGSFDLYLIDFKSAGGAGLEMTFALRAADPLTPIVIYSSDGRASARGRPWAPGLKPWSSS